MDLQQRMERVPVEELREIGVRFTGSETRANDWALVLASAGIGHRLERILGGFQLLVKREDVARSSAALDAYDRENPARVVVPEVAREYGETRLGLFLAALLLGFHAVVRAGLGGLPWRAAGASASDRIVDGEWWRVVTALTLHGDLPHVLGNAVSCALFVTLLGRRLGPGLSAALVLLAGAGGNWLNALVHRGAAVAHVSIGASTALFGAVGLLGAVQAVRGRRGGRRPSWVPLAASLGILAMLGSGKDTDMLAHLFGLLVGGGLGLGAAWALAEPPRQRVQVALLFASLAAVVGCWLRALGV